MQLPKSLLLVLLQAVLLNLSSAAVYPTSQPVTNAAAKTFSNGTELVVQSHHARAQTTISWNIPAAHGLDRVVVYQDKHASAAWLKTWNAYSPNATASMTNFDDAASVGSWCEHSAYSPDAWGAFHSATVLAASDVSAIDKPTWFYTSTRGQNAVSATAASPAAAGTIKVVLADVGLFRVCMFAGAAVCPAPTYCVTAEVYQPPTDYMEIDSTSIVENTFTRYNLVSRNSTSFDWLWLVGSMDGSETPASMVSLFVLAGVDELSFGIVFVQPLPQHTPAAVAHSNC
jgi:hypothetical protein